MQAPHIICKVPRKAVGTLILPTMDTVRLSLVLDGPYCKVPARELDDPFDGGMPGISLISSCLARMHSIYR